MKKELPKNTFKACCAVFCVLLAVHAFEAIILRTDETIFGENFLNKLFGVFVLWLALRILGWKWSSIGFSRAGLAQNVAFGLSIGAAVFFVAYAVELFVLRRQGYSVQFGLFTTGFSLTGAAEIHRGVGFILMCVLFNIVNVVMEEGTFRGLFYGILKTGRSTRAAVVIQALLFGVWHVVTPLRSLIDGDFGVGGFIGMSVGYILLAGMMGVKWALMHRMTGSLYAGMADHFFNNCIGTNLLHLSTESGTDQLMILRILIAQLLSFFTVCAMWRVFRRKEDLPTVSG